jgi:hypothetical protein
MKPVRMWDRKERKEERGKERERERERERGRKRGARTRFFFVYMLLRQPDTCSYIHTHTTRAKL